MIEFVLLQMGSSGMGGPWGFAFVGPAVGLLVMAAIVYVLWKAVSGTNGGRVENDSMETLRQRYARGEIDDEEYEERARRLQDR